MKFYIINQIVLVLILLHHKVKFEE